MQLQENYIDEIKHHFDDKTVLIVDDSDINKDSSKKLDSLRKMLDGRHWRHCNRYWYSGVTALTATKQQPIPVYGRVYSSHLNSYQSILGKTISEPLSVAMTVVSCLII